MRKYSKGRKGGTGRIESMKTWRKKMRKYQENWNCGKYEMGKNWKCGELNLKLEVIQEIWKI